MNIIDFLKLFLGLTFLSGTIFFGYRHYRKNLKKIQRNDNNKVNFPKKVFDYREKPIKPQEKLVKKGKSTLIYFVVTVIVILIVVSAVSYFNKSKTKEKKSEPLFSELEVGQDEIIGNVQGTKNPSFEEDKKNNSSDKKYIYRDKSGNEVGVNEYVESGVDIYENDQKIAKICINFTSEAAEAARTQLKEAGKNVCVYGDSHKKKRIYLNGLEEKKETDLYKKSSMSDELYYFGEKICIRLV